MHFLYSNFARVTASARGHCTMRVVTPPPAAARQPLAPPRLPPRSCCGCLHASVCEPAFRWAEASYLQLPMPLPGASRAENKVCLHASACVPASRWAEASYLQLPMPLPGASRAEINKKSASMPPRAYLRPAGQRPRSCSCLCRCLALPAPLPRCCRQGRRPGAAPPRALGPPAAPAPYHLPRLRAAARTASSSSSPCHSMRPKSLSGARSTSPQSYTTVTSTCKSLASPCTSSTVPSS
jgi:hypothetical protein